MLFDLRSRGRRRTVQFIYFGLALLMLGGLVLFGVGAGNNNGGLLNAFTNNGSGNGQSQVADKALTAALKATKQHPTDASAWATLVQTQYQAANEGSNFNSATSTFTASGKKALAASTAAWQRYVSLTKSPQFVIAQIAGHTYMLLGNYSGAAGAWEYYSISQSSEPKGFECLALSAYAAKQTRKGELAAAKMLSLLPKADRLRLNQELSAAKKSASEAQQLTQQTC